MELLFALRKARLSFTCGRSRGGLYGQCAGNGRCTCGRRLDPVPMNCGGGCWGKAGEGAVLEGNCCRNSVPGAIHPARTLRLALAITLF